ncbi:hypothetical protein CJ030_MR4G008747 [Morella rubra]|uniref:DUF4408 domain-containing protein n=1 Tax=Morella rubra TaxID=262757 RepID=A0A6A1VX18_9ROSI|nr:hypothetical protein CJ030_MR4G008747 [Morella rubra]
MDHIKIEKVRAINKYNRPRLLDNLFLYSLTALTCSLYCSSHFWFPGLSSAMNVFLSVTLPKVTCVFLSYKFVFIVGNLIVVVLIGESKILSSDPSPPIDVLYDEYINWGRSLQSSLTIFEVKRQGKAGNYAEENVKTSSEDGENFEAITSAEGNKDSDGNNDFALPAEELSKRADDLIARMNKQRRLEARLLLIRCNHGG